MGTRRVYLAGVTPHPDGAWITQQARQHAGEIEDHENAFRYLIRDRDTKFTESFDAVFRSERIQIIRTPFRAPNVNAYAERWVRSVREECLDHLLILNQAHSRRVLRAYVDYYNVARPHQGLEQQSPIPPKQSMGIGLVRRRPVLGGILNDYYRPPASSPAYLH